MNHGVREFVEGCDRVLAIGTLFTDFNTGAFTANINPDKLINIAHHRVHVGSKVYPNVEIGDLLVALAERMPKRNNWGANVAPVSLGSPAGTGGDPITADALYPRWANFLRAGATFWSLRPGLPQWDLDSLECPAELRFTIRRYGYHWLGYARRFRSCSSSSRPARGTGNGRRSASGHGTRNLAVRAPRSSADHLCCQ